MTKYFGDIPRGKPITRPKVGPVTLQAEKRLVFEDRVQVPRLYLHWPTVGETHDDRFALDVLATILAGPRTARITKALVYDEQSAASVQAGQSTNEDVGEFILMITPRTGHNLTISRPRPMPSSSGSRRTDLPRRKSRRRPRARNSVSSAAWNRISARPSA